MVLVMDRKRIYEVALRANCHEKIARRALKHGVETVRPGALRDALAAAIAATEPSADGVKS